MKRKCALYIIFVIEALLILNTCYAEKGQIKLLAVQELEDGSYKGSTADLFLEIKKGEGRVFLETFPLSKIDTQISTRFAKEVSCNYLNIDCDNYDFFYTMQADSSIVGGPSAGGAIAVLTASMLKGLEIDQSVAITGTINSGGLIGPVGGLNEKIDAAAQKNISKVVISRGSKFITKDNMTFDLEDYADDLNVKVVEAVDLNDVIFEFTGEKVKEDIKNIDIDSRYSETMKFLSKELCDRSDRLYEELSEIESDKLTRAINLTEKARIAKDNNKFYSSASYCFGANVVIRQAVIEQEDYDDFSKVEEDIKSVEQRAENAQINTITDLQAYMIVKDRVKDAKNLLKNSVELYEDGKNYSSTLAFCIERTYSAETWMSFFDMEGKKFILNDEVLKKSCQQKIGEAEERLRYAQIYFASFLEGTNEGIKQAYKDFENEDYGLCLFRASKSKAEADSVITVIGVGEDEADEVLENRLSVVKRIISEQKEGVFPILGYSYYEYSKSLADDDIYSALLYSQYALELSNLNMYFKEADDGYEIILQKYSNIVINPYIGLVLGCLLAGLISGIFIGLKINRKKAKVKSKRKKDKKNK